MDITFYYWLYERLSMYNEINIVNTSFHKFKFNKETITLQDCIDRMIKGCKIAITTDSYEWTEKEEIEVEEVTKILALCIRYLWW